MLSWRTRVKKQQAQMFPFPNANGARSSQLGCLVFSTEWRRRSEQDMMQCQIECPRRCRRLSNGVTPQN